MEIIYIKKNNIFNILLFTKAENLINPIDILLIKLLNNDYNKYIKK